MNDDAHRHSILAAFSDDALFALTACQVVEEILKSYLTTCNKIIVASLKGAIPYKYTDDEIDNYALERLVALFQKLNSNDALIAKLNKLPNERNYCAHKAFVMAYLKSTKNGERLEADIQRVNAIGQFAWGCFQDIKAELAQVEEVLNGLGKDV